MRWAVAAMTAMTLAATACTAVAPAATPTPAGSDLTPILATTMLRVGTQRIAFLLHTPTSLVSAPEAQVTTSFMGGDAPGESKVATFHLWPFGTRGTYVTELTFDRPGDWTLEISVDDGTFTGQTALTLHVAQQSTVRDVGERALFSNTKTLASAEGDLSRLTSGSSPDPDLYRVTVAEALISGNPSVIVFASPAFCTSPTCGPQVEAVSALKDLHKGDADFVHVEVYDNPQEIQGDLSRGVYAPALSEWGIDTVPGYLNESWVFVLGRDGRITARFEGYATVGELEAALLAAS